VIEAVDMPDIAPNAYPIAFGDWSTAYRVYDKPTGFSVLRDPFSVATKGLVRFHARRRVGGQVVMAEAVKTLKSRFRNRASRAGRVRRFLKRASGVPEAALDCESPLFGKATPSAGGLDLLG
jgi:hypothetical protein